MVMENNGIEVVRIGLGYAVIKYNEEQLSVDNISLLLENTGFSLTKSPNEIITDKIKKAIIDLVFHMNNMNSIVQKSEYLVEILDMNYAKISRIFKKETSMTLEKYIILVKTERIKDMLENDEYSLSEIAYMMDYSSVQYLSTQFKKVTGVTVSDYKTSDTVKRIPLDKLLE